MTSSDLIGTSFFGLDLSQLLRRILSLRRRVSQQQLLLEFDQGLLRYAVGRVRDGQLRLNSLGRMELPDEALERGVPTDPKRMASFIRQLCQEHNIAVNQVSVAFPLEAAFVRVVDLPVELSQEQARQQVLDPELGPQLPLPLVQTDFDLAPAALPLCRDGDRLFRRYLLVAIPSDFTTRVVNTMELAELNLQRLELSSLALLRLQAAQLLQLRQGEFSVLLELQTGCTLAWIVAGSGPVAYRRMVSIRDFPEPELSPEQSALALSESLCAEEITVHDPSYLALSELDLRLLINEVREWMAVFAEDVPDLSWSQCWTTGVNSAHPLLEDMLSEALQIPCQRVRPLETEGLAEVGCTRLLIQSGLGRLVGLASGFMPSDSVQLHSQVELDTSWQVSSASKTPLVVDAHLDPLPAGDQTLLTADLQVLPESESESESESEFEIIAPQDLTQDSETVLNLSLDRIEEMPFASLVEEPEEARPSIPDQPKLELRSTTPSSINEDPSPDAWPTIHQPVVAKESELSNSSEPHRQGPDLVKKKPTKSEATESPLGELRFNDD